MKLTASQKRFVTQVEKRITQHGSCAVFRTGDKLHYAKSAAVVPELLVVYDLNCPAAYLHDDARAFVQE